MCWFVTLPLLTVTGADGEANAPSLSIEDHVKALHDDGSHYCARTGLGHSKLVAVLLGRCHILYWPQVLLKVNSICLRKTSNIGSIRYGKSMFRHVANMTLNPEVIQLEIQQLVLIACTQIV